MSEHRVWRVSTPVACVACMAGKPAGDAARLRGWETGREELLAEDLKVLRIHLLRRYVLGAKGGELQISAHGTHAAVSAIVGAYQVGIYRAGVHVTQNEGTRHDGYCLRT